MRDGLLVAVLWLAGPLAGATPLTAPEAEALFVRRVQPLLQEKCLACHGRDEEKIKGGLEASARLASSREGGDSLKPAIVAGQPDQSPSPAP